MMRDVLNIVKAAIEWQKARHRVCGMMTSDDGYKNALNHLSECEDKLASCARELAGFE